MIFYFSATGNSKYVAERIASECNEQVVSIQECINDNTNKFCAEAGERVGFISPTYFWGLPINVKEFLQRLKLENAGYIFFVATYGTTTGQIGTFTKLLLEKTGLKLDAGFSVKMPDTWTPVFNLSDTEKVKKCNLTAEAQLLEIIGKIKSNVTGDYIHNKLPMFAVKTFLRVFSNQTKTSHFHVEDTCTGCGLCVRKCPVHAIELQNKKPVWVKDTCVTCLGCLHRCPAFAIQYGKNTKRHGQYLNPNTKV